jgi:hypothetical protein
MYITAEPSGNARFGFLHRIAVHQLMTFNGLTFLRIGEIKRGDSSNVFHPWSFVSKMKRVAAHSQPTTHTTPLFKVWHDHFQTSLSSDVPIPFDIPLGNHVVWLRWFESSDSGIVQEM